LEAARRRSAWLGRRHCGCAKVSVAGAVAAGRQDEISEPDVPAGVLQTYGQAFVHWCFAGNRVQ
jgi:hypothetical protein